MGQLNEYEQVMEQVKYPDSAKSRHRVVCTQEQANKAVGKLYTDDPSWRIVDLKVLRFGWEIGG